MSLAQLWLPILLSGVALFFASFLSWMVLGLHKPDWGKIEREDDFLDAVRRSGMQRGRSYMFPNFCTVEEMKGPDFQRKFKAGPNGLVTVFVPYPMPRNLALTFVSFLVASAILAYVGTIGLPAGAPFLTVFRFFSAASLLAFLFAIVQHSIWFQNRIVGHVIESIAYSLLVGAIFAALWPAGA